MDYEKDVSIDESCLDVEWLEQPRLLIRYAQLAAKYRRDMELSKESLDIVKADLDLKIREDPESFGLTKVTEAAIQSAIILDERYKKAYKDFLDSKYEADMAQAAVNAINQRKDALENLVRLFGMQYFAGPRVPRDLTLEAQKRHRESEVNRGIGSKLKRTNN